jgi:hypothetical protein
MHINDKNIKKIDWENICFLFKLESASAISRATAESIPSSKTTKINPESTANESIVAYSSLLR